MVTNESSLSVSFHRLILLTINCNDEYFTKKAVLKDDGMGVRSWQDGASFFSLKVLVEHWF
jgi:hypothetical protein